MMISIIDGFLCRNKTEHRMIMGLLFQTTGILFTLE
jgi:hypothetical protein